MRVGFTPVGSVLVVACATWACGGAEPDTEPATHDDFRAIQRQEARIETALAEARDPGRACDVRCDAAGRACDAAGTICRIAEDTADLDVRARCRHANDACREATRAPSRPPPPESDVNEPCRCHTTTASQSRRKT